MASVLIALLPYIILFILGYVSGVEARKWLEEHAYEIGYYTTFLALILLMLRLVGEL